MVVDQDQVRHADLLEVHPQRVDPEVVEPLRVAGGDVTRHPFVEPELPEQSEGGGEALLAVQALFLDRLEGVELGRNAILRHPPILRRRSREPYRAVQPPSITMVWPVT